MPKEKKRKRGRLPGREKEWPPAGTIKRGQAHSIDAMRGNFKNAKFVIGGEGEKGGKENIPEWTKSLPVSERRQSAKKERTVESLQDKADQQW